MLRLVRGLVPVPEVLEVRPARPDADQPGLLVTSFLPGVRGDELLPTLDAAGLARGRRARSGGLVADLGGMPMLRAGPFVDPQLAIGDFGARRARRSTSRPGCPELGHLSPEEIDGLREVALDAQVLLDSVPRACLVHSDLNPKNLLLDPDTLALTGVLDWEFAHAGHPFTDLGNLLRFDRDAGVRRRRAGGVRRAPRRRRRRTRWPWPGPPTCGRWWTSRPRRAENPVAERARPAAARDRPRARPGRLVTAPAEHGVRLDPAVGWTARGVVCSTAEKSACVPDGVDSRSLLHRRSLDGRGAQQPSVVKPDFSARPHDICPPKESPPL